MSISPNQSRINRAAFASAAALHQQATTHEHRWTNWGPYHVPAQPFLASERSSPSVEPIEAYRTRDCECGAWQRETYATHERQTFGERPVPGPAARALNEMIALDEQHEAENPGWMDEPLTTTTSAFNEGAEG